MKYEMQEHLAQLARGMSAEYLCLSVTWSGPGARRSVLEDKTASKEVKVL